jgi:hypothetical protein
MPRRRKLTALTIAGALALLPATAHPQGLPAAHPQGLPPGQWLYSASLNAAPPPPQGAAPGNWVWLDAPEVSCDTSYRNALLITDGSVYATGLTVALSNVAGEPGYNFDTFWTSTLPFLPLLFSGPIVHLAKQQPPRALASLAMRAGFFSAGVVSGGFLSGACSSRHDPCRAAVVTAVTAASLITPLLIDAFLLSKGRRLAPDITRAAAIWPVVAPAGGGLVLGLGGAL